MREVTVTFSIHQRLLLHTKMVGDVTIDDVCDYIDEVFADDQLRPGYFMLLEYETGIPTGINLQQIQHITQVARQYEQRMADSTTAIVVKSPLSFGMFRTYMAFRRSASVFRVFSHRDDAIEWLLEQCPDPNVVELLEELR